MNEGEEVMRTGSLYRGIGKSRESRRTVQQHTNTPRLAEEIKYGTARMGNTTSTNRDIYFFEDQVTIAERRRVLMAKTPKNNSQKPNPTPEAEDEYFAKYFSGMLRCSAVKVR